MEDEGRIKTQFDDLLHSLKSSGKALSAAELSSMCGMPKKDVFKWLQVLEKSGQVRMENRIRGVYVSWLGESPRSSQSGGAMRGEEQASFERQLSMARQREEDAYGKLSHQEPERHSVKVESSDMEIAEVGEQLRKIDGMIEKLREKKELAGKLRERTIRAEIAETKEERTEEEKARKAAAEEARQKKQEKEVHAHDNVKKTVPIEIRMEQVEETAEEKGEETDIFGRREDEEKEPAIETPSEIKDALEELRGEPGGNVPYALQARPAGYEAAPPKAGKEIPQIKLLYSQKKKQKIAKIKKPGPVQVTGVSLQFSERLARQMKRINSQLQEIEKLRMEKEQLLAEHYMPMQHKLEVEIETISDRVLRMEKSIMDMHQRASDLPTKVGAVEKLQLSTIKAHAEMRKAYDEASALIEESNLLLSEEREKMAAMVEQSRQELAEHRAKTEDLQGTLTRIAQMEAEAAGRVMSARAALAEQAERLATAEKHSGELTSLKEEIQGSVEGIKREMSSAKGALTGIEKQMQQMRQIEIWSGSIREDYEKKMHEIDDYIRNGNQEFDTLRESVEANFARRYLRELRQLTDSYSFEFDQVKKSEAGVDERIGEARKKLDELLDEGRKISYLYEMQSKEVAGGEKFEQRSSEFDSVQNLANQRTQIEQMIAQVVGGRSAYEGYKPKEIKPKVVRARKLKRKPGRPAKKAKKKARR